jgi:arylsulfatase A-like enzyme
MKMRTTYLRSIFLLSGFLPLWIGFAWGQSATENEIGSARPNIVFFLVDDLGAHDLGYTGSTFHESPAIDTLASEGVVFTQGYSAFPRCVPARFAFLSGKYPARAGVPGTSYNMEASEVTVAEAFKEAGYRTFFAGKWHLMKKDEQSPENQGFDINIAGGHAGAPASYFFPYGGEQGKSMGPGLEEGEKGEYLNDRLTDETIQFLRAHQRDMPKQPFFIYLSHYAVHTPLEGPKKEVAFFQKKLEEAGGPQPDGMIEKDGETKQFQDNVDYAAMVKSMDRSLGRVREALKELKLDQNTIIVFTSDHGGLSNRGLGKGRELATSNAPLGPERPSLRGRGPGAPDCLLARSRQPGDQPIHRYRNRSLPVPSHNGRDPPETRAAPRWRELCQRPENR